MKKKIKHKIEADWGGGTETLPHLWLHKIEANWGRGTATLPHLWLRHCLSYSVYFSDTMYTRVGLTPRVCAVMGLDSDATAGIRLNAYDTNEPFKIRLTFIYFRHSVDVLTV